MPWGASAGHQLRAVVPGGCRHGSGQAVEFFNLVEPGKLYGDRLNAVDLRFGKIVKYGRTRTNVGVDFFNITNAAPVLTYNQTFVLPTAANPKGSWLTPTSVLQSRYAKISAQIDF